MSLTHLSHIAFAYTKAGAVNSLPKGAIVTDIYVDASATDMWAAIGFVCGCGKCSQGWVNIRGYKGREMKKMTVKHDEDPYAVQAWIGRGEPRGAWDSRWSEATS